jgi:hypothetical protein
MMGQSVKHFKLHALSGLRARHDLAHDVGTWRIVVIIDRLAGPSHIGQDGLAEVPTEQRVGWTKGVVKQAIIKRLSSDLANCIIEIGNLVSVLKGFSRYKKHTEINKLTSGLIEKRY